MVVHTKSRNKSCKRQTARVKSRDIVDAAENLHLAGTWDTAEQVPPSLADCRTYEWAKKKRMVEAVTSFQIVTSKEYDLSEKGWHIEAPLANAYYLRSSGRPVVRCKGDYG